LGFADTATNRIGVYLVVGAVFALTLPFVVRGCALVEAWLARALLTGVAQLRDQVADLTQDRATARAQTGRRGVGRDDRPCAGWSATSTTGRSSGWSASPSTWGGPGSSSTTIPTPPAAPSTRP
jgi:hypothetical protein